MRTIRIFGLIVTALVALTACGSGSNQNVEVRELLSLSDERPTFIYFFTDN
jgi:hypothetical protein